MSAWSGRRGWAPMAKDERGIALPVAVFALALIGALVAGSFLAGLLEQQSGQSTLFAAQAREGAEAGIAHSSAELSVETLENLPVGGAPLDLGTTLIAEGVIARSQIERLTSRVFLIRAHGQKQDPDGIPLATRSLGVLVRPAAPATAPVPQPESPGITTRVVERGWVRLY